MRQAAALAKTGKFTEVVYINLPFDGRKFYWAQRQVCGSEKPNFKSYHVSSGNLAKTLQSLKAGLSPDARPAYVINSWEMSASCYRYREDLVFAIHQLLMTFDAAVYVYSQVNPEKVVQHYLNRCGLGKLTLFASNISNLIADREERKSAEAQEKAAAAIAAEVTTEAVEAPPIETTNIQDDSTKASTPEHSEIEVTAEGVFAHLDGIKTNDLGSARGHLSPVALDDMIEEDEEDLEEDEYQEEVVEEGELEYA
jgi:hypothetical protein